jgi:hypothetical protein
MRLALATIICLASPFGLACSDGPTAPGELIAQGVWGGRGIRLTVTAAGGTADYGCDIGSIGEPLVLNQSRFSATGTYTYSVSHSGQDTPEKPHPARYEGTVNDTTMELTVYLVDLSRPVGPFQLTLGRPAVLARCAV